MNIFLRRRKLGRTSTREIARYMTNDALAHRNDRPAPAGSFDYLFRWGTTSIVDHINHRTVVNTAEAIQRVGDKLGFRYILQEAGLCPKTWFDVANVDSFPVVVRPGVHAQGRHLYVCHFPNELRLCPALRSPHGYYISELIYKVAEYRVMIVQGRVAWVAKKTPGNPGDVAWNVARGGRFDNVDWGDWPLKGVRLSIDAFNLSGLDFGAVDIMVDKDNNWFVLEINSAPSQTSPYRQQCTAKCFDYIVTNGKRTIPLASAKGNWKKFIHPAVSNAAIIVNQGDR